jgi:hypothetical protein
MKTCKSLRLKTFKPGRRVILRAKTIQVTLKLGQNVMISPRNTFSSGEHGRLLRVGV